MALVSVIIPTYNRVALLPEAIDSVFAQTYRDIELIVVDDGSTDDTRDLLAGYGNRLQALFLPHAGYPPPALNAGIRAAHGEFIAFLDSDDRWLPDKLDRQMALLDGAPQCGFAYGNVAFLYPDGSISPAVIPPKQLPSGRILRDLVRNMFIHPSTLIVRRTLLERVGLFDEDAHGNTEYALILRLARLSEATCIPEPVALVRRHAGQYSESLGGHNYELALLALERLAREPLPWSVRLEVRRSSARYHTHLARLHLLVGERDRALLSAAKDHLAQALRAYPLHRPAWGWAVRALLSAAKDHPGRRE